MYMWLFLFVFYLYTGIDGSGLGMQGLLETTPTHTMTTIVQDQNAGNLCSSTSIFVKVNSLLNKNWLIRPDYHANILSFTWRGGGGVDIVAFICNRDIKMW